MTTECPWMDKLRHVIKP